MITSIREGRIENNQRDHVYTSDCTSTNNSILTEGLDFILSHFEEPIWPRTVFTHTSGRQLLVYSKQEALARFKQANFIDCRINAYPYHNQYHGINRQTPNFIFIDLDGSSFISDRAFWLAVNKACKNIKGILGGNPTVLWTGNGIHVYQPVDGLLLELESLFSGFDRPSQAFLKFAAQHLSNHKCDMSNNPAFRSCLVRIPRSHNFKCVQRNNFVADHTTEVNLVQSWNSIRPKINPLLYDFHIWLADREIKEIKKFHRIKSSRRYQKSYFLSNTNTIPWIEKLLQTPLADYRKNAISLIVAPYLVKIKRLPYNDAFSIIQDWLNKCIVLRQLDSNFNLRIKYALQNATEKNIPPMKFETLREKNGELYDLLNRDLK